MLLSYSWLTSYLPELPPPNQLAELLMLHGLDVERVHSSGDQFDRVVVGQIVGIKPHPNADKLRLAEVLVATDGQPQEIVCGAPNIEVGQKVPVALLGAKLPNGLTIEPRAIRGVTSNGMLCAEDELGLGQSHAGILVLNTSLKLGTPFAEALHLNDAVIDVTTPANRADLMSMRGLAREIGAMLNQAPLFLVPALSESTASAKKSLVVESTSPKNSPVFTARVIRGLKHQPTPQHIVQRLQAAGMRSINAIVDCTNYIMLEYGQPLHAYDAAKVQGGSLTVRAAKTGEHLITLDGKQRSLSTEMLVIADGRGPVGLAGVMGGRETEVSAATTDIILEAAIFDPVAIRKTSRRLGLVSEASKRFEKGLWPELTIEALNAAAAMIVDICGGSIEQGIVKTGKATSPKRTVKINPASISDRLGQKVPNSRAKEILERLGFDVKGTAKAWTVGVPVWRTDVAIPEDVVDEVGRMVGYANVPFVMPQTESAVQDLPSAIRFQEEVKNILVDLGFSEIISHAFYGEKSATQVKGEHFIVANPLDSTQHKLRKSLLPQLSEVLLKEADAGHDAEVFEIGLVFDPTRPGAIDRQQHWKVAIGIAHKGEPTLTAVQKNFQEKLGTTLVPEGLLTVGPTRGRIVEFCEFELNQLMSSATVRFGAWDPERHIKRNVHYREPSKYPSIVRDVSLWWPKDPDALFAVITDFQQQHPLLWETATKDQFTKDGKTSFLISFVFQSAERTLTKAEVDAMMARLENAFKDHGATIR